jgi:hypothetical protein
MKKLNGKGKIEKHKETLVSKGFSQQPGIDNGETFSPIARLHTIRAMITIGSQNKWSIYQMDVKSTFLHGNLEEEVYAYQPMRFEVKGQEYSMYKLKKALYVLKEDPRSWYS